MIRRCEMLFALSIFRNVCGIAAILFCRSPIKSISIAACKASRKAGHTIGHKYDPYVWREHIHIHKWSLAISNWSVSHICNWWILTSYSIIIALAMLYTWIWWSFMVSFGIDETLELYIWYYTFWKMYICSLSEGHIWYDTFLSLAIMQKMQLF